MYTLAKQGMWISSGCMGNLILGLASRCRMVPQDSAGWVLLPAPVIVKRDNALFVTSLPGTHQMQQFQIIQGDNGLMEAEWPCFTDMGLTMSYIINLITEYKNVLSWLLNHLISATKCCGIGSKCHKWDNNEFQIENPPWCILGRHSWSGCNIERQARSKLHPSRGVHQNPALSSHSDTSQNVTHILAWYLLFFYIHVHCWSNW